MSDEPTYEDIQKRAYELWEKAGKPHGYDMEFWAQAVRELKPGAYRPGDDEGSNGSTSTEGTARNL